MTVFARKMMNAGGQAEQGQLIVFEGFPFGLNTNLPADQIAVGELSDCINFKIRKSGGLQSRYPVVKYSNTATAASVVFQTKVFIDGTAYELVIDSGNVVYYFDSNLDPVSIGTLEGDARAISYNDVAVLLDGSYIKYLSDVSSIKIAYDAGDYQFDNSTGSEDSTLQLGNGTNTRIASKFTSQAWDAGYTIPPTTVAVKLTKAGTPSATAVTAVLRLVSDDSVLATKELLADATELTGVPVSYDVTYEDSDITTEMGLITDYYMSIEHAGGSGVNHVLVHCSDVTSGGVAFIYSGSWAADATADPIMSLKPGRPPKGAFGVVHGNRLWVSGDPDNKSRIHFGGLTYLDWSTSGLAGYIDAVDDSSVSFPVGAIETMYNELYAYGTKDQPFLCKLSGATPASFSMPKIFQKIWATHKTIAGTITDIWTTSFDGVDTITGVQEYGDIRAFSLSEPVDDRIKDYWDRNSAFAAYNHIEGEYLLAMPDYHRVLVARTKYPVSNPDGKGARYPWTEYEFYRDAFLSGTVRGDKILWDSSGDVVLWDSTDDVAYWDNLDAGGVFTWVLSGSGENEYYLLDGSGADPGVADPDVLTFDHVVATEGTVGSLNDHAWAYGDNDTLGFNTIYFADASGSPEATGVIIRSVLIPSSFATYDKNFFIGSSDGFVYKFTDTEYKDGSTAQIMPRLRTAYMVMPLSHARLTDFQIDASTETGAKVVIDLYINGNLLEKKQFFDTLLPLHDDFTLGEATMQLKDAIFTFTTEGDALWKRINFKCRSFMVGVSYVSTAGDPLYINSLIVRHRNLRT